MMRLTKTRLYTSAKNKHTNVMPATSFIIVSISPATYFHEVMEMTLQSCTPIPFMFKWNREMRLFSS
ncbi:hypothetical protein D3C85_1762620 [compost metagenome]